MTAWTVYAISAGSGTALICWFWRQPVRFELKAAALAIGSFLVAPYVMAHDTALLVVAVAFLVKDGLAVGFRRGDIEIYALTLCAPLYPVFVDGIVPLLPAVYSGLLVWVVLRARTVSARIDLDTGLIARTP